MANKTIVETYPDLVKVFGSKNPLYVGIALIPLCILFLNNMSELSLNSFFLILLGALYWTFLEYAIHRWVYHTDFKSQLNKKIFESFHIYHHKNMSDLRVLNAGPLMIYPMAIITLLPFYFLLNGDISLISNIALGLLGTYFFYEIVHYGIHYKKYETGYFAYIQKYHFYHHEKQWKKNYGNTSHIWDLVFQTYDKRYKEYDLSQEAQKTLITSQKLLNNKDAIV